MCTRKQGDRLMVRIDTRRDYELYVKTKVSYMSATVKVKQATRKLVMQTFDDGIAMNMGKLVVQVND